MRLSRLLATGITVGVIAGATAAPTRAAPPENQADCVGQYVNDYRLIHGDPIGAGIGHPTGYAHSFHPFGQTLSAQATSPADDCLFDLTP